MVIWGLRTWSMANVHWPEGTRTEAHPAWWSVPSYGQKTPGEEHQDKQIHVIEHPVGRVPHSTCPLYEEPPPPGLLWTCIPPASIVASSVASPLQSWGYPWDGADQSEILFSSLSSALRRARVFALTRSPWIAIITDYVLLGLLY